MENNIRDLFEQYINYCSVIRNFTDATVNNYKRTLKLFLEATGITDIHDITQDELEKWFYKGRLERNWSPQTFRHYHKHLNCFLKWLIKKGLLENNPAEKIEKPKLEKKLPRTLSKDQAKLVLDASYHMNYRYTFERFRNRGVIAIMLFAGLRKSEVINLKLNDVCFDQRTIFINQGKGSKDRVIPMNLKLYGYLKEYKKRRDKLKYADISYFFLTLHKPKPFSNHGIKRMVNRIKKKTKLDFSPHSLRHSFATLMLEGGCDIYTLSKIMGHSKITTTTIYLYCSNQQMSKSIEMHSLN